MDKEKIVYMSICIVLFISMIVLVFLYVDSKKIDEEDCLKFIKNCSESEKKALMFGFLESWGEDPSIPGNYLLNIKAYNFEEVEAKNVKISCNIYGREEDYTLSKNPTRTIEEPLGNFASLSERNIKLSVEKRFDEEGFFPKMNCFVSSCESCELLLDKMDS